MTSITSFEEHAGPLLPPGPAAECSEPLGRLLHVSLQTVHVDGTVVLVSVASLVVRRVSVFLLLDWSNALLQLDQAGHVRGKVVVLAARWRRLVAAVLLVLVAHHLLDANHGLCLTDQRYLIRSRSE